VNNRYGVDVPYFTKELAALSRSLPDRTPDELNRYLLRLAEVAKPLKAAERRKTVRRKPPVQQRKGKICPSCRGRGWNHQRLNRNYSNDCKRCGGTGKLSPVA